MKILTSKTGHLLIFFSLTIVLGWLSMLPFFIGHNYHKSLAFLYLYSPAICAVVTVFFTDGSKGIKNIFRHYLYLKFSIGWYLLAFFLVPVIIVFAAIIMMPQNFGVLWTGRPWYFIIASFLFLMIINSGEEIGWRGFALPKLQSVIKNPLMASIVLGIFWGVWHLPLYMNHGQTSFPLVPFLFFLIGLSIIYTVLFNNTQGSLFMAILFHASNDIVPRFLNITFFTYKTWFFITIVTWIVAVILYFPTKRSSPVITA